MNLSTRGRVGHGDDVLIGGFVIDGVNPKRVLVRAAGPSLVPLGVTNALTNPRLRVMTQSGQQIASNDDWGQAADAATLPTIAAQLGAFAWPTGSRDAAAIVTLEPGPYTVIVDSADNTEGIALVEAYEIPP